MRTQDGQQSFVDAEFSGPQRRKASLELPSVKIVSDSK